MQAQNNIKSTWQITNEITLNIATLTQYFVNVGPNTTIQHFSQILSKQFLPQKFIFNTVKETEVEQELLK